MNERIKELVEQAGFGSYAEIPDTYIVHKNDLVEFAELIVKECACVVEADDGATPNGELLFEHFGIEE